MGLLYLLTLDGTSCGGYKNNVLGSTLGRTWVVADLKLFSFRISNSGHSPRDRARFTGKVKSRER